MQSMLYLSEPDTDALLPATVARFNIEIATLDSRTATKFAILANVVPPVFRGQASIVNFYAPLSEANEEFRTFLTETLLVLPGVHHLWTLSIIDLPDLLGYVDKLTPQDYLDWNAHPEHSDCQINVVNSVSDNAQQLYDLLTKVGLRAYLFFRARFPELAFVEDIWGEDNFAFTDDTIDAICSRARYSLLLALNALFGRPVCGLRTWIPRAEAVANFRFDCLLEANRRRIQTFLTTVFCEPPFPNRHGFSLMKSEMTYHGAAFDWESAPLLYSGVDMFSRPYLDVLEYKQHLPALTLLYATACHQLDVATTGLSTPPDGTSVHTDSGDDPHPRLPREVTNPPRPSSSSTSDPADLARPPEQPLLLNMLQDQSTANLQRILQHLGLWAQHEGRRVVRANYITTLQNHYAQETPEDVDNLLAVIARCQAQPTQTIEQETRALLLTCSTDALHDFYASVLEKPAHYARSFSRDEVILDLTTRAAKKKTAGWKALLAFLKETPDDTSTTPQEEAAPPPPPVTRPPVAPKPPLTRGGGGRTRNQHLLQRKEESSGRRVPTIPSSWCDRLQC